MGNVIRKAGAVVFNLADPDQLALWEHTQRRTNFSGYIKRLIQRDMEGWTNPGPQPAAPDDYDLSQVKSCI